MKARRINPTMAALFIAKRKALGLTQKQFWSLFGVTQSAGCRYETERFIPKPLQLLFPYLFPEG